jgi:hypothetical protein
MFCPLPPKLLQAKPVPSAIVCVGFGVGSVALFKLSLCIHQVGPDKTKMDVVESQRLLDCLKQAAALPIAKVSVV